MLEDSNLQFHPKLTLTGTFFFSEFPKISGELFCKRERFLLRITDTSIFARYVSNLVSP